MDTQADRWTDRRTDRQTDKRTTVETSLHVRLRMDVYTTNDHPLSFWRRNGVIHPTLHRNYFHSPPPFPSPCFPPPLTCSSQCSVGELHSQRTQTQHTSEQESGHLRQLSFTNDRGRPRREVGDLTFTGDQLDSKSSQELPQLFSDLHSMGETWGK